MKIKEKLYNYFKINDFKGNVTNYIEARIELLRMDVEERFAGVASKLIYAIVKIFLVILAIFTGLQLLGNVLNHYFNSFWLGNAAVLATVLIALLIWVILKEKAMNFIQKKTQDSI